MLLAVGGELRQGVHATVHIGLDVVVAADDAVDHAAGRLAGGSVVEIDERTAVHFLTEYRELPPQSFYIHVIQLVMNNEP